MIERNSTERNYVENQFIHSIIISIYCVRHYSFVWQTRRINSLLQIANDQGDTSNDAIKFANFIPIHIKWRISIFPFTRNTILSLSTDSGGGERVNACVCACFGVEHVSSNQAPIVCEAKCEFYVCMWIQFAHWCYMHLHLFPNFLSRKENRSQNSRWRSNSFCLFSIYSAMSNNCVARVKEWERRFQQSPHGSNRSNGKRTTIIMPCVLWFDLSHVDPTNVCICSSQQ